MIRSLFTDIADIYDRMNHVLSIGRDRHWRQAAVRLVDGRPAKIVDLACGTGDFTFALARRFPDARIVGIDLTPAMLERARGKNTSALIDFREGDAMAPLADGASLQPHSFDLVACAFGFRNFSDSSAALRAARALAKPDGELLVLEFFRPANRLIGSVTALWLTVLARLFAKDKVRAYVHLRESMRTTDTEGEFVARASAEGFALCKRIFLFPCCTCLKCRCKATSTC